MTDKINSSFVPVLLVEFYNGNPETKEEKES